MNLQPPSTEGALKVGFGLPVAIMAGSPEGYHALAAPLARQGLRSCPVAQCERASGVGLLIVDADAAGGVLPALLVAGRFWSSLSCPLAVARRHCHEQVFPLDPWQEPIQLRAPLSGLTVRVLVEYLVMKSEGRPAMRDALAGF